MESLATNRVFLIYVGLGKVFVGKTYYVVWLGGFLCLCLMLCIARHNMVKFETLDSKHICVFMKYDSFG